jgi:hypothetical protein
MFLYLENQYHNWKYRIDGDQMKDDFIHNLRRRMSVRKSPFEKEREKQAYMEEN